MHSSDDDIDGLLHGIKQLDVPQSFGERVSECQQCYTNIGSSVDSKAYDVHSQCFVVFVSLPIWGIVPLSYDIT